MKECPLFKACHHGGCSGNAVSAGISAWDASYPGGPGRTIFSGRYHEALTDSKWSKHTLLCVVTCIHVASQLVTADMGFLESFCLIGLVS